MTDDLAKARGKRAAKKRFGNHENRQLLINRALPELWDRCALTWPSDDDVRDRAIFGEILSKLVRLAEFRLLTQDELIEELNVQIEEVIERNQDESPEANV